MEITRSSGAFSGLVSGRSTRRLTAVVLAATGVFALVTFGFTWLMATRRSDQYAAWASRFNAAVDRVNATTHLRVPWSGVDPTIASPNQQLETLFAHVATLSLVFAVFATVMAVLVTHRRSGFAILAAVTGTASVALGAGPLSLVVGTIGRTGILTLGVPMPIAASSAARQTMTALGNSEPSFVTPMWWRIVVALGVGLMLAATLAVLHRAVGDSDASETVGDVPSSRVVGAVAIGYLLVVGVLGAGDTTTLPSGTYDGAAIGALLVFFVGLGIAAAAAGASLAGRSRLPGVVALTLLIGFTVFAMWAAHFRAGGAPQVFGWIDMGSDPPLYGTPILTAAIVAAVPAGWGAATLTGAITARFGRRITPAAVRS